MIQETEATLLAEDMKSKLQAAGWTNVRLTTLRELAKVNLERALRLIMYVFASKDYKELYLMDDVLLQQAARFIDFREYSGGYYVRSITIKRLDMPLLILEE